MHRKPRCTRRWFSALGTSTSVLIGMGLACFGGVMRRMRGMPVRDLRVMRRLFVVSGSLVLCCFLVMLCRRLVVRRRTAMVIGGLVCCSQRRFSLLVFARSKTGRIARPRTADGNRWYPLRRTHHALPACGQHVAAHEPTPAAGRTRPGTGSSARIGLHSHGRGRQQPPRGMQRIPGAFACVRSSAGPLEPRPGRHRDPGRLPSRPRHPPAEPCRARSRPGRQLPCG